jgi:hypothetical protein
MKPSIWIDLAFGVGLFLVLALAVLFGWQMPEFVYVMF